MLAHHEVLSAEAQNTSYSAATASCKEIRIHLETSHLPQHKLVQVILYIIYVVVQIFPWFKFF